MQNAVKQYESISALTDGELRADEFAHTMAMLDNDAQARATWHAYHVTGDVLRSGASMVGRDDLGFVSRLNLRLQDEPGFAAREISGLEGATILIAVHADSTGSDAGLDREDDRALAANSSSFRWKMVAAFASVTTVAVLGWQAAAGWGGLGGGNPQAMLAQVSPAVEQAMSNPVMIRDPHLDALMAAHKQFGGTSALQMPAGFLRNATFEVPAR